MTTAAPAAAPAAASKVDFGTPLAAILEILRPLVDAGVEAAEKKFVPSIVQMFLPDIAKQYVDPVIVKLEADEKGKTLTVPKYNGIIGEIEQLVLANEPAVAKWVVAEAKSLVPVIDAELAKLGFQVQV